MSSIRDTAYSLGVEAQLEYLAQIAESFEGQVARTRNVLAAACVAAGGELVIPAGTFESLSPADSLESWNDEQGGFHVVLVRGGAIVPAEQPPGPAAAAAAAEVGPPAPQEAARERVPLGIEPQPIPPPLGLVEEETTLSDGGQPRTGAHASV